MLLAMSNSGDRTNSTNALVPPRSNWYEDNMKRAYAKLGNNDGCFDHKQPEHVEIMKNAGSGRKF